MENIWVFYLMAAALFLLLFFGFHIVVAVGISGIIGFYFGLGGNLSQIQMVVWNSTNSSTLAAVTLFTFLAEVLQKCRLSDRLYTGSRPWVSWLPGGLIHVNIASCSIFAAVSGSSTSTAAAIGVMANEEMKARRYDPAIALGSIAGGATLGILIPPSIPMILYAFFTEASIGRLFMAGVVPGIILSLCYMTFNAVKAIRKPDLYSEDRRYTWQERFFALKDLAPTLSVIAMMLGGIYMGFVTPNEAAALGSVFTLVVALLLKELTMQRLWSAMKETAVLSGFALIIMVSGSLFAYYIEHSGLAAAIVKQVGGLALPPFCIYCIISLIYIVMGCFLDSYSIMVLAVPVSYPIITSLGYDPVWFGIMVVILIETGLVTPPYGINLFVVDGIAGGGQYNTIVRGIIPYLLIMFGALVFFYILPGIVLWLPNAMMGKG